MTDRFPSLDGTIVVHRSHPATLCSVLGRTLLIGVTEHQGPGTVAPVIRNCLPA